MARSTEKLVSVEIREGIAYLRIDVAGAKVNTLSPAMTDRMEEILDGLRREQGLEGAVIYSGKKDNFIAGFDIEELERFAGDPGGLRALVERGHALMEGFESLGVPFVAAIDGAALGGGLEIALACQGRVATDNPKTKLGLPEVMLGLLPGAGGTQRLPRLIDLQLALDMILSGKLLSAEKAYKEGLVDDVVHPGILLDVAAELARSLKGAPGHRHDASLVNLSEVLHDPAGQAMKMVASTPARSVIFNKARETVVRKTGGHYPAPLKALEVIECGLSEGFDAGIRAEAEAFVDLATGDVSQNLVHLFFMKNEADKDPRVSGEVEPVEVRRMGVLGAGLMGAGIAQLAAYNGYNVRLKDRDLKGVGWGLNYAKELFDKAAEHRKMTRPGADVAFGRISGTTSYDGIARCELVIEAVFEDLDLKRQILADVEALGDAAGNGGQIFASNTSTLPIASIAKAAKRPENVVGMHFFSPVHKMPLLEIIKTDKTSDEAIATALDVGRDLGKTCIVVADGPGFFTSRVIGAYINEAGWILQEGSSIERIDRAMKDFGFPVGPMKLIDEVGIDVALKAAGVLGEAFSERWDQPSALRSIAEEGRKGRKNELGMYDYAHSGGKNVDESVYDVLPGGRERNDLDLELIQARCWLAMLNECAYCLQEGIVAEPRDIDLGVIFGLGFPPFRGGILRYADSLGLDRVVHQLDDLADRFGVRLRPAPILVEKAEAGESFYP